MTIVDWRELTPEQVAPLYEQQARAWMDTLGWDLSASWAVVERARVAGALPGLVCRHANRKILGWTFFMRQDAVLQIGVLVGHGAGPVRELLEAILDSPEAGASRELTCLLYPAHPNALSALTRRRFVFQPHRYLTRTLDASWPAQPHELLPPELVARRWQDEDGIGCVRLLERAYAREPSGRALAPNGTLAEWAHYLGQLVRTPACGTLLPKASFVIEERETALPVGVVLTTSIGPDAAHIAQMVVDPAWTRRGIGRSLLRMTGRAAAAAGLSRITLLVSGENEIASRLYGAEGFEDAGPFVFASRPMPVRRQLSMRRAA